MIVDCFTHTWESDSCLGRSARSTSSRRNGSQFGSHRAAADHHRAAADPVDVTLVLGFKSAYLGAQISNDAIAAYVATQDRKMIGIAGVDPANPKEATNEMRRAAQELGMKGLAVSPAGQDFHPTSSHAMNLYAQAEAAGMPIIFHTGIHVAQATKLEYGQPVLLDEVAREFPNLRILIARMGSPWIHETLTLLRKHENVFAEISGLFAQPWRAYEALLNAYHCGVLDKLLFGSGFPDAPASLCIESLYSINHLVHGTNLPAIPREQLRGIVERDALSLLGIAHDRPPARQATSAVFEEVHDEV